MPPALPGDAGTSDGRSIWGGDHPGKTLLDISPKGIVHSEFGDLGPFGATIGMPLCGEGSILKIATASRRVASELARDRRGRAAELGSDLPHPEPSCVEDGDLFSLGEGQVSTGKWSGADGSQATSLTEPPSADRR